MTDPDHRRTGMAAVTRAVWGGLLLAAPGAVLAVTVRNDPAFLGPARVVLRVLGARHLVQAGVEARWPRRRVLAFATVVDGLHAATGLALGAADRKWRRPALLDAAVASGFALTTARTARPTRR